VAVKTTEPLQGARRLQGILLAAGPEAITLELDEPGGAAGRDGAASLSVPLSSVQRAHAVFEWTSPAKRTKSPAGAKETG
jgi:ribosome maturation factor RimP